MNSKGLNSDYLKETNCVLIFYFHQIRFQEIASKSRDELINLGFPKFTLEDFHETVRN